jgi:phosphatidylinositol alpha-1,6-mannosyltransferase
MTRLPGRRNRRIRRRGEDLKKADDAPPNCLVFSVDYKPQPGGIAEHAHKIALHLTRLGGSVCVLAPKRPGCAEFDLNQPFPTVRVSAWPGLDVFLYFFNAFRLIRKRRIRVVYCATSHPCGLVCMMLRALLRFKYTITIHAHEVVYSGKGLRPFLKRLLRPLQVCVIGSADRVFAVSRFTRDALEASGVSRKKTAILLNGVDPEELTSSPRDRSIVADMGLEGKPVILTVARLDIHKGHDTIIRALPAVLREVPDAVYVIVGDGPMRRSLENLSRTSGVYEHVVFAGYVSRAQTLAILEACNVFAMVSRIENGSAEGFGIVFLEAGVFSKPVVGGRSGGIPDAVADGETGLLVDPLDAGDVAGALCRILTDPGLASRMGQAGRDRAMSGFTWDRTVRTLVDTISGW